MKKLINLGAIQIAEWSPKNKKMFSWGFYYKEPDYYADLVKCNPDEVVLPPEKEYTLVIDYPVETPYKAKIETGKKGVTRLQLADKICKHYRRMYAEEDETSKVPALLGIDGGNALAFNRQQTTGKYGIWGHVIEDLVLVNVKINGNIIEPGVDS